MPPIRLSAAVVAALVSCASGLCAAESADAKMLVCSGTLQRGSATVAVQLRITRPPAHDRMLALVDRSNGMAQQLIRPQVGEGTIELTESVRGVSGTTRRYPFVELRSPESAAGTPMIGLFFAGDMNPAVLRADLWDKPARFTLDSARDALAVNGSCD